jgi:hypothetical protein
VCPGRGRLRAVQPTGWDRSISRINGGRVHDRRCVIGGQVSLHNASTALSDGELSLGLRDLQSQVGHAGEFWWHWGLSGSLDMNGLGVPITITDYPGPDEPEDCLGYHWVDAHYRPYAVVFAGLCRDLGKPTSAIISHELMEMLADLNTNAVNLIDLGDSGSIIVDLEVCDPCEELYYEGPTGIPLSDFVYPRWFDPDYRGQVDLLGRLPGPLRDASGAMTAYQTVTVTGAGGSDDDDDSVMDAAAGTRRAEVEAAYGSRAGIVDQLRARSTGTRAPFPPPACGAPGGRLAAPALERRKQPATRGGTVKVVRRADIPVFVEQLPF